ncbi:MAG: M48 family metalloprotease [Nitrososphaerota archaeon]|nr:M48 family metalloprotease [Nitrososphaerota archaeon]
MENKDNKADMKKTILSLITFVLITTVSSLLRISTIAAAAYLSTGNPVVGFGVGVAECGFAAFEVILAAKTTSMTVAAVCAAITVYGWFILGLAIDSAKTKSNFGDVLFMPPILLFSLISITLSFILIFYSICKTTYNQFLNQVLNLFDLGLLMIIIEIVIVASFFLVELYVRSKLKKAGLISIDNNNIYVVSGYFQGKPLFYNAMAILTINPKIAFTDALLERLEGEEIRGVFFHEEGHVMLKHIPLGMLIIITSIIVSPNFFISFNNYLNIFTVHYIILDSIIMLSIAIFLIFLIRRLIKIIEAEADWYAFKKAGDLYPKTLNALYNLVPVSKSFFSKFLDTHGSLENRLKAKFLDPASDGNFLEISLSFIIFSAMGLTTNVLRNIQADFHTLPVWMPFFMFFSAMAGMLLFSLILYRIFRYAGFNFSSARLSVISYVTITIMPFSFPVKGFYNHVIANISALLLSIYILRKEGFLKAIVIWLTIFLINILSSWIWLSLISSF